MIYVEFWGLSNDFEPVIKGTIAWDGQKYILNPPDSILLQNIMRDRIPEPGTDRFTGAERPEEWLSAMDFHYHGSRFWASDVKRA